MQAEIPFALKPLATKILILLLVVELMLVGCYWVDVLTGASIQLLHGLFDLDGEGNIPTWFSSAQLIFVALALWNISLQQRPVVQRPQATRIFFALAGCGAIYVSLDETAQIHERITASIGQRYVDWLPSFAGSHLWLLLIALAGILTLTRLFLSDLLAIWREHRRLVTVAALGIGIGLAGGMGLETLGYKLLHGDRTTLWYKVEVTLEEFMEMLGASLILFSALKLNGVLAANRTVWVSQTRESVASVIPSLARVSSRP